MLKRSGFRRAQCAHEHPATGFHLIQAATDDLFHMSYHQHLTSQIRDLETSTVLTDKGVMSKFSIRLHSDSAPHFEIRFPASRKTLNRKAGSSRICDIGTWVSLKYQAQGTRGDE